MEREVKIVECAFCNGDINDGDEIMFVTGTKDMIHFGARKDCVVPYFKMELAREKANEEERRSHIAEFDLLYSRWLDGISNYSI